MHDRAQSTPDQLPPLGGFLPLASPGNGGLVEYWGIDPDLAWGNATSALAALVAHLRPGAVWLPGFFCAWPVQAVPQGLRRFYPLGPDLQPDRDGLRSVRPGDMVLATDLFGRAPGPAWRAFVADHPGVTFVEDRAHALDPGQTWGDWQLFSIRKVLGVPEGGFLVPATARARGQALPGPRVPPDPARVVERLLPMLSRAEAPDLNRLWHPLHQVAEAGQTASPHRISRFSRDLAFSLNPASAIAARKANYAHLADALPDLALLGDPRPGFAPLGFPLRLPADRRDSIQDHLARHRIFAAVHWRDLAAPQEARFAGDHALAAQSLTLPVDPGLDGADLDRVVATLREVCP